MHFVLLQITNLVYVLNCIFLIDLSKSIIMTEMGSSRDEKRMKNLFENMKSVVTNPVHGFNIIVIVYTKSLVLLYFKV